MDTNTETSIILSTAAERIKLDSTTCTRILQPINFLATPRKGREASYIGRENQSVLSGIYEGPCYSSVLVFPDPAAEVSIAVVAYDISSAAAL